MIRAALLVLALAACSPQPVAESAPEQAAAPEETEEYDPRCWYGGCEGPFYSAAPVRFGRFEVGDRISAIPDDALDRVRDCGVDIVEMDCAFTLPDGVEYLVYEQWIARKRIVLPTTHALPFGLRGDERQDEIARRISELLGVNASIEQMSSGRTRVSHEGTLGTLENPQWLDFEFDESGRLSQITWQGPQTT